jgi:hypothetical protein
VGHVQVLQLKLGSRVGRVEAAVRVLAVDHVAAPVKDEARERVEPKDGDLPVQLKVNSQRNGSIALDVCLELVLKNTKRKAHTGERTERLSACNHILW